MSAPLRGAVAGARPTEAVTPPQRRGFNESVRRVLLLLFLPILAGAEILWLAGVLGDGRPRSASSDPPSTPAASKDAPGSAPARVSGVVVDESDRPVEGAGVYGLHATAIVVETVTDAAGRFALPEAPPDTAPYAKVAAVARGTLAAVVDVGTENRAEVRLRLKPDAKHGRLEITLLRSDGSPAADARVWVSLAAHPFPWDPDLGVHRVDDGFDLARQLRARLERAADLADQEIDVAQGACGVPALRPDSEGRVRIPALLPGTYRIAAAARIQCNGKALPPDETLFISAYCMDGLETGAEECVDATAEVPPPPATTACRLVLRRARSFEGRIVVDSTPGWGSGETHFLHVVEVEGCPWPRAEVETGHWEFASETHRFTGDFHLDGVPRTACRVLVSAGEWVQRPPVSVDLPAVSDDADGRSERRMIHVPDGRLLDGKVTWSDGTPFLGEAELTIEGYAGKAWEPVVVTSGPDLGKDGPFFRAFLDRPLAGTETAVLRLRGDPPREFRFAVNPADPDPTKALVQDLVIPAPPAPPEARPR